MPWWATQRPGSPQSLCSPQTPMVLGEMQVVTTAKGRAWLWAALLLLLPVQCPGSLGSSSSPAFHAESPLRDGTAPSQEGTGQPLSCVTVAQEGEQSSCRVVVALFWCCVGISFLGRMGRFRSWIEKLCENNWSHSSMKSIEECLPAHMLNEIHCRTWHYTKNSLTQFSTWDQNGCSKNGLLFSHSVQAPMLWCSVVKMVEVLIPTFWGRNCYQSQGTLSLFVTRIMRSRAEGNVTAVS